MPTIVSHIIDAYLFRRTPAGVEFLLLKRSPGKILAETWQSVHGKIETGETAVAAARRELHEETGLVPLRFWQLDYVNTFYVAATDQVHLCPCFAAEIASNADVRLSHEHTAYRWLPVDDAQREFLWPGQRRAIEEIRAYILTSSTAEPHLRIPD